LYCSYNQLTEEPDGPVLDGIDWMGNPGFNGYDVEQPINQKRSSQQINKQKQLFVLRKFFNGESSVRQLQSINKSTLLEFLNLNKQRNDQFTKQDLISLLQRQKQKRLEQKRSGGIKIQQSLDSDIFGNEIVNPVIGDDGVIYDRASLDYYFSKNLKGEYKIIKYIWHNDQSVPNYVIVGGNKPLTKYKILGTNGQPVGQWLN